VGREIHAKCPPILVHFINPIINFTQPKNESHRGILNVAPQNNPLKKFPSFSYDSFINHFHPFKSIDYYAVCPNWEKLITSY
jgi:hypothetical protein